MTSLDHCYQIIKKPVITEKTTDQSVARNAYTFRVPRSANKIEVRDAVERLFDVKVLSVNTLRVKGKWRRRGRTVGVTPEWKKAMVQLADGQTIDVL